jgi:hypothetical protein
MVVELENIVMDCVVIVVALVHGKLKVNIGTLLP